MKDRQATVDMIYNTQQEYLIMPEYGRNVQQLVRHAQTIQDPVYRQSFCEEIVTLIQQLYPQSKSVEDYREKLWKHLFQIAKYDLDVQTPSGEVPTPEDAKKRPQPVPYPAQDTRFRHYGNHVQVLIAKALTMEEGPIKEGFVHTIGSYMKLAYKTWNREHFISDEIIKNDLKTLSGGKLGLDEDSRIDGLANATRVRSTQNVARKDGGRDSRGGSNNRGRDGRDNREGSRDNRGGSGGGMNKNRPSNGGSSNNNNPNKNKRK